MRKSVYVYCRAQKRWVYVWHAPRMGYLCSRMCVNRGGEGGGMEVGEKSCYEHKNVKSKCEKCEQGMQKCR